MSSLSQLLAVMEILISTLGGISSLIIFEGLNPLLLTQKVSLRFTEISIFPCFFYG